KKSAYEIAEMYTKAFLENMQELNIIQAHILCKATDHIKEQINMVKAIEKAGATYATDDGIYFDTSTFPNYAKLAKLNIKGLQAGSRIDMKGKKQKTDFALWKFAPPGEKREMEWESPWGRGFPGWHIECSAMATKYLGEQFDLHTGGIDHIPVHHSNEIAQAETATGKSPWVKYWLHGEFLVLEKDAKMSKSLGNFITLRTLTDKGYDPLAYRYLCLTAHYRKKLTFSLSALDGAANTYARLKEVILSLDHKKAKLSEKYVAQFEKVIADDLNTPKALAVLWNVLRNERLSPAQRYSLALHFDKVLGLGIKDFKHDQATPEVAELIKAREQARKAKDFQKADEIREKVHDLGYEIDDTADGAVAKKL
ncbi:MAG: cysteine--tRNA ligase, partial [Candidatus Woesearchaeota archaeon]|nr:cysteine--tRNA ligase [Candidatus Woesearchaeota archaeon]